MTNKELESLNVKIAKKMGWTNFRKERTPEPMNTRRTTGIAPGNIRHQFVPFYTNNLAYAMQLVDWANKNGYSFRLEKEEYVSYEANFKNSDTVCTGHGTLPSMAICMAFLEIE
jgi:hypothetical protein